LDGESTRAFGVGLVGNSTDAATASPSSSASSSAPSGSGSGSPSSTSSASQSSSTPSQSSSPNSAMALYGGDMLLGLLGVLFLSLAGMMVVM
jgi:hypothetical protein